MRHRIHHRFTDSPNDPYDSTRGFWYSHILWLFQKPPRFAKLALIGSHDLKADPVVRFQHKYLLIGYIIFGGVYPAVVGKLLGGDYMMGFLWIGVVSRFISWHCIWSINSVSHWVGEKDFSVNTTKIVK
jgi:stearoyl-CoA desaturase (delta-9 desaturase)